MPITAEEWAAVQAAMIAWLCKCAGDGDNEGLMKAMMMGDDGEEHPIMVAVRV